MPKPRATCAEKVRQMKCRRGCGRVAFPLTDAWNPRTSASAFFQNSTFQNVDVAHCTPVTRNPSPPAVPRECGTAACGTLRCRIHPVGCDENARKYRLFADGKPWSWSDQYSPLQDRADTHDV